MTGLCAVLWTKHGFFHDHRLAWREGGVALAAVPDFSTDLFPDREKGMD